MTDPLTLGLAAQAVGIVNGTIGLLKDARDAAKRSDDHDLKDKLSDVFDAVLELKELIGNLRDDPFCPACFDNNGKQIRLTTHHGDFGTVWKYECKVCKNDYPVSD